MDAQRRYATFVVVQGGPNVRACQFLHALELAVLARRDDLAVRLGLPFGDANLRLLALEPARLAAAELAAGDAGIDARLLIRLALVDPRRRPYDRLGRTRQSARRRG